MGKVTRTWTMESRWREQGGNGDGGVRRRWRQEDAVKEKKERIQIVDRVWGKKTHTECWSEVCIHSSWAWMSYRFWAFNDSCWPLLYRGGIIIQDTIHIHLIYLVFSPIHRGLQSICRAKNINSHHTKLFTEKPQSCGCNQKNWYLYTK